MGFGTEILFILMLGLLVLGPKQLYAMLGRAARAKAELENAARGIKAQLATELEDAPREGTIDSSTELAGEQ
jgi:Sec-independent protein translocase protein TatA